MVYSCVSFASGVAQIKFMQIMSCTYNDPVKPVRKWDGRMEKCLLGRQEIDLPEVLLEDVST